MHFLDRAIDQLESLKIGPLKLEKVWLPGRKVYQMKPKRDYFLLTQKIYFNELIKSDDIPVEPVIKKPTPTPTPKSFSNWYRNVYLKRK